MDSDKIEASLAGGQQSDLSHTNREIEHLESIKNELAKFGLIDAQLEIERRIQLLREKILQEAPKAESDAGIEPEPEIMENSEITNEQTSVEDSRNNFEKVRGKYNYKDPDSMSAKELREQIEELESSNEELENEKIEKLYAIGHDLSETYRMRYKRLEKMKVFEMFNTLLIDTREQLNDAYRFEMDMAKEANFHLSAMKDSQKAKFAQLQLYEKTHMDPLLLQFVTIRQNLEKQKDIHTRTILTKKEYEEQMAKIKREQEAREMEEKNNRLEEEQQQQFKKIKANDLSECETNSSENLQQSCTVDEDNVELAQRPVIDNTDQSQIDHEEDESSDDGSDDCVLVNDIE